MTRCAVFWAVYYSQAYVIRLRAQVGFSTMIILAPEPAPPVDVTRVHTFIGQDQNVALLCTYEVKRRLATFTIRNSFESTPSPVMRDFGPGTT